MPKTRNSGRNTDGTFSEGNPGKPMGSRHKATQAVQGLLDDATGQLTQKAIAMALEGDAAALRMCLERICPPRKDSPVEFDLPEIKGANDAAKSAASVLDAVSNGRLTPLEGATVMGLLDSFRRTLEASEFETRLEALENAK